MGQPSPSLQSYALWGEVEASISCHKPRWRPGTGIPREQGRSSPPLQSCALLAKAAPYRREQEGGNRKRKDMHAPRRNRNRKGTYPVRRAAGSLVVRFLVRGLFLLFKAATPQGAPLRAGPAGAPARLGPPQARGLREAGAARRLLVGPQGCGRGEHSALSLALPLLVAAGEGCKGQLAQDPELLVRGGKARHRAGAAHTKSKSC